MKNWRTLILTLCFLSSTVPASAASGTEAASFLDIPVGAGPAALGGAYSALAMDAYAPVYNPAGLAFLNSTQVAGQHLDYLESIHYEYLGAVHPFRLGGLGISAQYLGSGDITGADLAGNPTGDYSTHYGAYSVSYGHLLGSKLGIGITGKWINAKISDVDANAYAVDLGGLYKVSSQLTLAAGMTNLGSKLKFLDDDSSLPLTGKLGLAYEPHAQWLLAVEGNYAQTGLLSGHLGLQWKPISMLALRAGYKTDTTDELEAMAGMSLGVGLQVWGQEFSYAWVPLGDLGNTQYFSLAIRFGGQEEDRKNQLQVMNIRKERTGDIVSSEESQQLMELLVDGDSRMAAYSPLPETSR
jgi:hypothetical protein